MRIALTYTRLRTEERMLLDAFEAQGVPATPVSLDSAVFSPADAGDWAQYDAVVDRCVSLTASLYSVRLLESFGIRCVNPLRAIEACSDKLATTIALERAGVPTPSVRVAVSGRAGIDAVEEIGYPAVLKPVVGSWGRLVSRLNDRDAAEAVLEHRETLGSVSQRVVYAQEHIDKPGRDLRVFVVAGRPVAAIARTSEHWVTNTARGADAANIELTDELAEISTNAVRAVGADIAAVDLFECPERGLLVNELNHSLEFRNSVVATGVDIPALIAQHVLSVVEGACA